MKTFKLTALATLMLASGLAMAATPDGRQTYIVQLKDEPAVSIPGAMARTPAPRGAQASTRFASRSPLVQAYIAQLNQKQMQVAASVGQLQVLHNYHAVFNGFSARLNPSEVAALRANAQVAAVFEDEMRKMDTITTPKFLGLTAPGGLWSQSVGGFANKGENMVVGIVDGGIWPENPAFADRVDGSGKPVFSGGTQAFGAAPASFTGGCMAGEGFTPGTHCNNKLVGAKFYNAGFGASGRTLHWSDFVSPRDSVSGPEAHGGHGDHTASTAAGNTGATAIVNGLALGDASGMAPRARVASYKVCWTYVDPGATDGSGSSNGCFSSDSVKAIDDAVKDGVNSINFSISGSQTSVNDPVEQAFYRAAVAGVFVAASAGNSGPANQVAHISPWISTVAASTHDRAFTASTTLGNGASYNGASVNNTAVPQTALIRAEDAGKAGAAAANIRLCYSSADGGLALDPAKVAGKIVVCTRGTTARVNKSLAVLEAGGVGMIMVDNGAGLVAEAHSVPTVHINAADGALVKTYAQVAGATAAIGTFFAGSQAAPIMAGFSSRGPNQGDANVLKPDLTAPGVDVIASVTPVLTNAQRDAVANGSAVPPAAYASYQGTSMSSPHVAGLSLLLKQAHPSWSPAAIKSALMTTAYTTLNDGLAGAQNGLLPWAQGAGHVDPNKATDPGLVYDSGKADWVAYQCKVNRAAMSAADCTTFGTLDETYNLNLPSITVGSLFGTVPVNVRRSVTNVGASTATYNASISVPSFTASVSPSTLTLAPGETKNFTVTLAANGAAENVWSFGALTWTDGTHVVRSPVQARVGKAITAPALVTSTAQSGSSLFTVKTGFAGRMTANKGGLKAVTMLPQVTLSPGAMTSAALRTACNTGADLPNMKVHPVTIPAGTLVTRFALRQQDVSDANDDFDMLIMRAGNTSVVYSGNDGSNEAVQLDSPAAGDYKVCVVAYGGLPAMSYRLSSWVVTPADVGGNFRALLPGVVYSGGSATVGVAWNGLALDGRYLGGVQFKDTSGVVQATTVIRVETGSGTPLWALPENSARKTLN